MMRDIASMVAETSPIIANIEDAVTTANDNILSGNQHLTSASGYQVILLLIPTINDYHFFFHLEKISQETLYTSIYSVNCCNRRRDYFSIFLEKIINSKQPNARKIINLTE